MNNAEILAELPKLKHEERRELFLRLCELQDQDLLRGKGPTQDEMELLDAESAEFERDGEFGQPWQDVLREIWPAGPE